MEQVLREPARKGAFLDLVFINREGLMNESVCLGHSDHRVLELQIIGDRRKHASKSSTLDMEEAALGLLKEIVGKPPWESAFDCI